MKQFIFLFLAIMLEVVGTSGLKASEQYFLGLTLKTLPVGIAYAIWSGVGIVLISVIGLIFFKQSLDLPAILGLGLIIAGVIVINIFSKTVSH